MSAVGARVVIGCQRVNLITHKHRTWQFGIPVIDRVSRADLGIINPDYACFVHVVIGSESTMLEIKPLINNTDDDALAVETMRQAILLPVDDLTGMGHAHR